MNGWKRFHETHGRIAAARVTLPGRQGVENRQFEYNFDGVLTTKHRHRDPEGERSFSHGNGRSVS